MTECLADRGDLLIPFDGPRLLRVGHGRGDGVELFVLRGRDSGPGSEDDIGFEFGNRLDVEFRIALELLRQLLALVLHSLVDPRHVAGVIGSPGIFLHADRCLAQSDRSLRRSLAEGDDAFGLGFDDRFAECVLDRHGLEIRGPGLLRGLRSLPAGGGGERERDERSGDDGPAAVRN